MRIFFVISLFVFSCRPVSGLQKDAPLEFPAVSRFSTAETLAARWTGPLGALWSSGVRGSFIGVDGIALRYVIHRVSPSKGAVVLLPGRTEAMMKYAEVIGDLTAQGYSTYALDVRGQGASDRLLPNHDKGYVVAFADYVTDLYTFMRDVVHADAPKDVFILAHSMSGATAVLFADEHPELVRAMVLSSPMLEINTGAFAPVIASSLGLTACSASDGTGYAIGSGDYKPEQDFDKSTVSSSRERWQWKVDQLESHPELRLGGVTWRWLCESLGATSRAQALGPYSTVPTLLLQATDDTIVKPASQERYCREAARCQLSVMEGARHELLQERDELRDAALTQTMAFFAAKASR